MVFSSMIFLWGFFPLILFAYFICPKKFKNFILLIGSLFFYAWGEPKYILLMLFSILINYVFGILINQYRKFDKIFLIFAIIINLGLLGYFKYFNFGIHIMNQLLQLNISMKDIALPIGISFYTFQIMSYIIDLYRDEIKVQKNILNLALYISFFPQLIAGPIVKYKDVEAEINNRKIDIELFGGGIKRFIYGVGKKVIFANTLALIADTIFAYNIKDLNTPLVWFAAITYTLQIYFDFSGYSDMAIGLGRMFGFHFPENFNLPYISQSITEFWRRWHISLSTWFKQYLYIPLGGNRKGKNRTYINLFIVFLATGLWHGASLHFVAWGIYYGIFLIIERCFFKKYLDKNKYKILNNIYVMFIVIIGWVLFRADGLRNALSLIITMFSFNFKTTYVLMPTFINWKTIIILILAIAFCGPIQKIFGHFNHKIKNILQFLYNDKLEIAVLGAIMCISIFELVASTYNPFIYFRF